MMVWSVHFVRNVGRLKGKVSWLMKMRLVTINFLLKKWPNDAILNLRHKKGNKFKKVII